jgi:hypothetical protein
MKRTECLPTAVLFVAGFTVVEELTKGALAGDRIWLVAKYSEVCVSSSLGYVFWCNISGVSSTPTVEGRYKCPID